MILWKFLEGAQTCIHYREESCNPVGKSEGKIGDWIRFSFFPAPHGTRPGLRWCTAARVAHGKQADLLDTVC